MKQEIAWSAEAEYRLRQRILVLFVGMWGAAVAAIAGVIGGLATSDRWLLLAAAILLIPFALIWRERARLAGELGWEESVHQGVRFPGSGMLANKPRDTSRLTKWKRQYKEPPGFPGFPIKAVGFVCQCHRSHLFEAMKWVPNVAEFEEEMELEDAQAEKAIDPEGGRFVLICECGMGHYMLKGEGS